MSANIISKTAFAIVATAGLSITAYAGNGSSRYGGPSVYDYESGGNCAATSCGQQGAVQTQQRYQQAPVTAPAPSARYGTAVNHGMQVSPGVVYVDCARMGTCAPQPQAYQQQPVYQAPQPSYTQQSYSAQTYTAPAAMPASCPAGTTAQSDGTCMQSSYSSSTSYSSTPSYSSSTVTSSYSGETVPCPAGTSKQSDGSCMQGSGSSYSSSSYSSGTSYSSGSSYGSSSSYSSAASTPVNCPAGTTAQSDGTCMEGGSASSYVGGTATIYSGDATSSNSYGGYSSDGSYSANSYLPIRK